jgi:hypothetical protein
MTRPAERRKRNRVALHWPVRLFRPQGNLIIESTTENLTSDGFYCVSQESFQVGERLQSVIAIPADSFGCSDSPISLQCRVRVMRVESQTDGFGLGCSIDDYALLMSAGQSHKRMTPSELLI